MNEFPDAVILDVDLSLGKITTRKVPGEIYRLYPGGSSLGLYLALQEMPGVSNRCLLKTY
jgi:aldehyde:ferredoxin oxidoreductase